MSKAQGPKATTFDLLKVLVTSAIILKAKKKKEKRKKVPSTLKGQDKHGRIGRR